MGGTKQIDYKDSGLSREIILRLQRVVAAGTVYLAVALFQMPNAAEAVPFAYVTNAGSGNVSVINTATNLIATTIPVGLTPEQIAITPNGAFAYVANSGSNTVSVIATASNTVVGSPIPVGSGPAGIAITPSGAFAYVANFVSNTVSVIATASNTVVATVPVGANPTGVAITAPEIPRIPTLSEWAIIVLGVTMAAALALRIIGRPV